MENILKTKDFEIKCGQKVLGEIRNIKTEGRIFICENK